MMDFRKILGLRPREFLYIEFPYKHEGKWHQASVCFPEDRTFKFFVNGEQTETNLAHVSVTHGRKL